MIVLRPSALCDGYIIIYLIHFGIRLVNKAHNCDGTNKFIHFSNSFSNNNIK